MNRKPVYFLVWGCPWPGFSGGDLRSQGLLVEASKGFEFDLVVFSDKPMSAGQRNKCLEYARSVLEVPLRRNTVFDKVRVVFLGITRRIPFHAAVVELSLSKQSIRKTLIETDSVVFCAPSHFAVITNARDDAGAWILGQYDAEVEFWRIKAHEERNIIKKTGSAINLRLSSHFYRQIYPKVGCVISVCEEDRDLTKSVSKDARVEVIENGADCSFFKPNRKAKNNEPRRMLFTGTSTERNIRALRYFIRDILPQVRSAVPDVELIIGGNFDKKAQLELKRMGDIRFTGQIEDIRQVYDDCDVFICPYKREGYGSKLKLSQALAMGICVVTTLAGARGFPLTDCRNALIADNDEEFIRKTVMALSQSDLREKIGENGREFALENLDWSVLGVEIRRIIADLQG